MGLIAKLAAKRPDEILFRLRQEAANLRLWRIPPAGRPALPFPYPPLAAPPDLVPLAEQILAHRIPLLGYTLDHPGPLPWRTDWLRNLTSPIAYFRRIPYLNCDAVGDHKLIWELSRHQHLVVLAQAWRQTGRPEFRAELYAQLEDWLRENPFQASINWTSALEVAFRALSWIWIHHLAGPLPPPLLTALYRHGAHLAANLSIYFSPNTHLLGEAVALHALGLLFGEPAWRAEGRAQTLAQMEFQVRPDGSHFEQSTYYHVYATDLFALHHHLEPAPAAYCDRLDRMRAYQAAFTGPDGRFPLFGDDDGGRLFHPYGERPLPPGHGSHFFPDSGLCVLARGPRRAWFDAGPFGYGSAGHSHADTLSLAVSDGARELLIDPGTYTYVGDPLWRNHFRGTLAHSTIAVDGLDQATPAGPFGWADLPRVTVHAATADSVDATCAYRGITHRRRIWWETDHLLLIRDQVDAPAGAEIAQTWRIAAPDTPLLLSHPDEQLEGWRSRIHGAKEPAPLRRVTVTAGAGPTYLAAAIDFTGQARSLRLAGDRLEIS